MVVLVTGSRNYYQWTHLQEALDELRPTFLIFGDARGADEMAWHYAKTYDIPFARFVAQWKRDGRAAGFRRNQTMLNFLLLLWCGWCEARDRVGAMPVRAENGHVVDYVLSEGNRQDLVGRCICVGFSTSAITTTGTADMLRRANLAGIPTRVA